MDPLRRTLATIQKHLGGLTATHKLLAGSAAVIAVLVLVLIAVLSGRASYVDVLPGATAQEQQRAQAHLIAQGFDVKPEAGRVMVRQNDAARASASLATANVLPNDKARYFESLIASQSWMNSRQVNEQNFKAALQMELGRVIAELRGVEGASVQMDVPSPQGLGASVRRPTASILLVSESREPVPQGVVDAAANVVKGSVAGLTLEQITVTDAAGGVRTVTTESNAVPGVAMEHAARLEQQTAAKLREQLSYIPGVKVTVTATVDVTRSTAQVQSFMEPKNGTVSVPRKRVETTSSTSESTGSATPGVEANQTADITRSSAGTGARTETAEENYEYENKVGSRTETIVDPKGQPTSVAVSILVPSGYVAELAKDPAAGAAGGQAPPAPDLKALETKFNAEVKDKIVATVTPHVRAMISQAYAEMKPADLNKLLAEYINVTMVPGDMVQLAGIVPGGGGSSGRGVGGMLGLSSGLIDKAVLGVLSLLALLMMFFMVKKAGRHVATPSAEELVGLPPSLDAVTEEVIGEADESETAMAGIEVGEAEMEAQKRLEQVVELVGTQPEAAGKLVGRWINIED